LPFPKARPGSRSEDNQIIFKILKFNAVNLRRFVTSLPLLLALVAQAQSQTQGAPQSGGAPLPPRVGLVPVHWPNLDKLEPEVREQLLSLQSYLASIEGDRKASDAVLGEAYGIVGQAYHAYSLTPAAKECYFNAHQLAPADYRWAYLLGNTFQQEGEIKEAVEYYKKVRRLRPDYLAAAVNLGNLYLQINLVEEARTSFASALALDATCTAAKYGLGQVFMSTREYARAAQYFEQALAEAPEANRINYALGMAYRGLGDNEKARMHLGRQGPVGVAVADPLIAELQQLARGERFHLIRGRLAFNAQRFSDAAKEFRKAVEANPASLTARVNLGSALAQTGDINGAIEQFEKATKIEPRSATAYFNLGLLYAKQNEHDKVVLSLRSTLGIKPGDAEARLLLARELLKAGRADESLAEFTRVVESEPDNEDALLDLVRLLSARGLYGQAKGRLERAHSLFPQKGRTAIALAFLLASSPDQSLRDGARALEIASVVHKATNLPEYGAVVALALAEMGRCLDAAVWQRQMIKDAERANRMDLVEKLKVDLRRYEGTGPEQMRESGLDRPPTSRCN
jgi:tetratricopeptide (TPR) repeat protein